MPKYHYKSTNNSGKIQKGVMDAANLDDLELRLDRLGLMLISHKLLKGNQGQGFFKGRGITRKEIILFCFHMEQLTRAGVPILKGLSDFRDAVDNPRFKAVAVSLVEDVQSGKTLSDALAGHPHIFNAIFVQLVLMGERTGQLEEIFLDLASSLKWEDELAAQTKKVMMYPSVVSVVVIALVFFMMIFLVPQLMAFILEMGQTPPIHTLALIATSNFIVEWWPVLITMPISLFITIKFLTRTSKAARRKVDDLTLKIWLFGPLLRKIILVRFSNAFALMYKSGITVLEALRICEGLSSNLVIQEALQRVQELVAEGKEISGSFAQVKLFPPLVLSMLQVGEATGGLDRSMKNVSYFFDREVKDTVGKMETMIEPALTVILGGIMGWVILSVLGPVYDLIAKV
ncbi:MAG: type II secretion system F family protein [Magnetococcales bacterium]|nr:type II secretion system F family protein [Magnetococcales bacterium]MBF0438005.1 type II secretion system F family protein [Magnetococcales bacterium]